MDTQLTHAMWVESGRCSVWGRMPNANTPAASTARDRRSFGRVRIAQIPTPTSSAIATTFAKNQRNSWCGPERVGSGQPRGREAARSWR